MGDGDTGPVEGRAVCLLPQPHTPAVPQGLLLRGCSTGQMSSAGGEQPWTGCAVPSAPRAVGTGNASRVAMTEGPAGYGGHSQKAQFTLESPVYPGGVCFPAASTE